MTRSYDDFGRLNGVKESGGLDRRLPLTTIRRRLTSLSWIIWVHSVSARRPRPGGQPTSVTANRRKHATMLAETFVRVVPSCIELSACGESAHDAQPFKRCV